MKRHLTCALCALLFLPACDPRAGQGGTEGDGAKGGPFQGRTMLAGQFVRTVDEKAPFYRFPPLAEAKPDLWLPRHTAMKLILPTPGHSKVELDTGEVGYISSDLLEAFDEGGGSPDESGPALPPGPTLPDQNPVQPIKPLPPPVLDPTSVPLPQ